MQKYMISFILIPILACADGATVPSRAFHRTPALRIVNGDELSPPHSQPYIVALLYGVRGHFCGGTLISRNFVLTSAHCCLVTPAFRLTTKPNITVVLGVHDWTRPEEGQVRLTLGRSNITMHPNYSDVLDFEHDIAVLRLPQTVTLTKHIQLVPLPTFQTAPQRTYDGRAYGWGQTSHTSDNSPVLRYAQFKATYNPSEPFIVSPIVNRVATCGGDSGGPYVANGMQIGIIDYISDLECATGEDGFISVLYFLKWINDTTDVHIQ